MLRKKIDRTSDEEVLPILLSGSPDWNIDRTFASIFYFPKKINKSIKNKPVYRNPIYLAKEYKKMIDSGQVKNQAELARIKGVLRARITQILNLLKFEKGIINSLEEIGDTMVKKVISERKLRKIIPQNPYSRTNFK